MKSVEWLLEELDNLIPYEGIATSQIFRELLDKSKEMHKQEVQKVAQFWHGQTIPKPIFNEYYQETFGGEGSHESSNNSDIELPKQDVYKLGYEDVPKLGYCEISDEEIEKAIVYDYIDPYTEGFINGAKWYREQLKQPKKYEKKNR